MEDLDNSILERLSRSNHVMHSIENDNINNIYESISVLDNIVNLGSYTDQDAPITRQDARSFLRKSIVSGLHNHKGKFAIVLATSGLNHLSSIVDGSSFTMSGITDAVQTTTGLGVNGSLMFASVLVGGLMLGNAAFNKIADKIKDRAYDEEEIANKLKSKEFKSAKQAFKDNDGVQITASKFVNLYKEFKSFFSPIKSAILRENSIANKIAKNLFGENYIENLNNNIDSNNDLIVKNEIFKILDSRDLTETKRDKRDIDKELNDNYKEITSDLYTEYLVRSITKVSKNCFEEIAKAYTAKDYDSVIESFKTLNKIEDLKHKVSNQDLNKYTLLSDIVREFKVSYVRDIESVLRPVEDVFNELKEKKLVDLQKTLMRDVDNVLKIYDRIENNDELDLKYKILRISEYTIKASEMDYKKDLKISALDFVANKVRESTAKIKAKNDEFKTNSSSSRRIS
jgi:hypothetical protein